MGKKSRRRQRLKRASPEALAAREAGIVINATRENTLVRLLDTAISMWFFGRDPFAIHLIICGAYNCLSDLGKGSDKGPVLEKKIGRFEMTAAYDFMRHAKPGLLNDQIDLPPIVNQVLLFDAINSFSKLFAHETLFMKAFMAHFAVWPPLLSAKLIENADAFLPKGVKPEDLRHLEPVAFFDKLTG